ncbi:MAG: ABC transporter permease [Chitinophagaceae bacterium]
MLRNYIKTAWRNLVKNKLHSSINIAGLSVGMAVAILIGLWIYDELSFNKDFNNYDRIGKIWQFVNFSGEKTSYDVVPVPLADELRTKYPEFKWVSVSVERKPILSVGEKKLAETGNYVEPSFTDMLSVTMLSGNRNSLNDINSILLSRTLAKNLFGNDNPIDKLIQIDNKTSVKCAGVYEDFPVNSSFKDTRFLANWNLFLSTDAYGKKASTQWDENSFQVYAQLREGADFKTVSAKIKDSRMKREDPPKYKPEFFIFPMSRWHLYADFKNGVNTGGSIQFVWLFGITGFFVLLLACINFMNLSTARSEKRAKEVGIRKAIGSVRKQLVFQFLSESLLVTIFAFVFSLLLAQLALPFFNSVADKQISILWTNPLFWLAGIVFSLLAGLIAGSYPALYLSSFSPIKVLKGTFKAGRFAAVPRKVLVVLQFSVSVMLIIGTLVVFRQVQFAKNRSVGYNREQLIEINLNTPELVKHYNAFRADLLNSGAVYDMSGSSGSVTVQYGGTTNIQWRGKAPDARPLVMSNEITHDYGRTIGWQVKEGRDFSRNFSNDSAAVILNEASVQLMAFRHPLDEFVKINGKDYRVIAVIKDMIKEDPFKPVNPSFYRVSYGGVSTINIKLSKQLITSDALAKVETVARKYNPSNPFVYSFVDERYRNKFGYEERIGKLSAFFATLAIFISCLGLFGVASFVAEQRTKEIGVRKVLGATVFNVWKLLSKEFIVLVIISLLIAIPVSYYFMDKWLMNYQYKTPLSWWIFATAGMGAIALTISTVSFQAIKAALANPVNSLRRG